MRVRHAVALAFSSLPIAASAIQTIDDIRWPESGAFAAYPEALSQAGTGRYFHAFVDGGMYRDSNLFRLSSNANRQSERFERLGVGLRGDIPISRQHILLEARADRNDFHQFNLLDNTSTRGSARWNWESANNWSGDLGVMRQRSLSGFGQIQAVVRDMVTESRAFGSAGFRITPDWRLRVGGDTFEYKHSEATRNTLNADGSDVTLGADYVTGLQNSIGAQVRYGRGNFPNLVVGATPVNGHYKETEPSVVAHYNLGGKSSIDGRLGYTERKHDQLTSRDFKGSTGDAIFHWTPTPKTLLDVRAYHETRPYVTNTVSATTFGTTQAGLPASFGAPAGSNLFAATSPNASGAVTTTVDTTSSYIVASGLAIAPNWAITDQIVVQAILFSERDSYRGDPAQALAGAPRREDKFYGYTLGAGWSPIRPLLLSVGYEHGRRTSNTFLADFDYNVVSANARYFFF